MAEIQKRIVEIYQQEKERRRQAAFEKYKTPSNRGLIWLMGYIHRNGADITYSQDGVQIVAHPHEEQTKTGPISAVKLTVSQLSTQGDHVDVTEFHWTNTSGADHHVRVNTWDINPDTYEWVKPMAVDDILYPRSKQQQNELIIDHAGPDLQNTAEGQRLEQLKPRLEKAYTLAHTLLRDGALPTRGRSHPTVSPRQVFQPVRAR